MLHMKSSCFLVCALLCATALHAEDWKTITVPGAIPGNSVIVPSLGRTRLLPRTWVKVPDATFTKHERNLFEESVGITIQDLADAHEVYLNSLASENICQTPRQPKVWPCAPANNAQ